jgi:uncharacterized membrane protein YcjF (UPF0283 family)
MKPIILHIGDRVHHKTLGDGVVIAVNEDYCTARFREKEANFRIPEAFVRGFLTSEDAKFGAEDGTEKPVMELLTTDNDKPQKKQLSRVQIWWRMFFLCLVYVLLLFFLLWQWIKKDDIVYLGFAAFFFIAAAIVMAVLMDKWDKAPVDERIKGTYNSESQIDPATKLMAGMMGAEMLGRAAKRERKAAEKRRYESLYWQESIRDKNPRHDFDYDHMDD